MPDFRHISFRNPLSAFASISLAEMEGVKLMNRTDTKYLTKESVLLEVLSDAAAAGYMVLETDDCRINQYDSVYFDTSGLQMFMDHHNRRLRRQKVRTRAYVNSGDAFLEIKRKNNKGRTKKKRIPIPLAELNDFRKDAAAEEFIAACSDFRTEALSPVLETVFKRITLVNPSKTERLTIDTCLGFRNFRTGLETMLRDAVIIELKQDGRAVSPMKGILLDHRVKPMRVSKYCIAVTLTEPGIKSGRFKQKVRRIEKTINHKIDAV